MDWLFEPLIGAVIGCFTNYIAIKMLFHPYREIRIFGWKLPFTPGMVPKRKGDIAKAIGTVVNEHLLGKEELLEALTKEDTVTKISGGIMDYSLNIRKKDEEDSEKSVGNIISGMISKVDIAKPAAEEIMRYIKEKTEGSFFGKFITEKMMEDLSGQIGEWIQTFMENDGKVFIAKTIDHEIGEMADMKISEILEKYEFEEEEVSGWIEKAYRDFVGKNYSSFLDELNIAGMIENKICAMDMAELEQLLLKVMKKELNAIVYLGALIGLFIGCINICF